MGPDGIPVPYKAPNGGGYTLEAALGICPNGDAEPDFMGWEVKQYAEGGRSKPLTLFTPEPDGGYYLSAGIVRFMRRYGYPPKDGTENRLNFSGIHKCGEGYHHNTGLRLEVRGFDPEAGKVTDIDGGIFLVDRQGNVAASWSFAKLIQHWNRKHAQAVYVPSKKEAGGDRPTYCYSRNVLLCQGTDFSMLLAALSAGAVYYDPGIKLENLDERPRAKKRSQFRVKLKDLGRLYRKTEETDSCMHGSE